MKNSTLTFPICAIGHITHDKVVTTQAVKHMAGGTAWYFTKALQGLNLEHSLITSMATADLALIEPLKNPKTNLVVLPSAETLFFENIYSANQDHRTQLVHHLADPFTLERLPNTEAAIYHLGPLLNQDISLDIIQHLATKGKVSLDLQGCLRYVDQKTVKHAAWKDQAVALPYLSYLKANEFELEMATGTADPYAGAKILADQGVEEMIVTLGSRGSFVLCKGEFIEIPAYQPAEVVDATGCGDTYMAGYLACRLQGHSILHAGSFGAAMATLKIEHFGPFSGSVDEVEGIIQKVRMP